MASSRVIPRGSAGIAASVRRDVLPLTGDAHDYDALLERIGDARLVLLGEASHGTHEFYRERIRITRRLIEERGFAAVAIEGDWPDALPRQSVRPRRRAGQRRRGSARGVPPLPDLDVAERRRARLRRLAARSTTMAVRRAAAGRASSASTSTAWAPRCRPSSAISTRSIPPPPARAPQRYECLQPFAGESPEYGRAVRSGVSASCRQHVVEQLVELRRRAGDYLRRDGLARRGRVLLRRAERGPRAATPKSITARCSATRSASWNLRDRHMADTLDHLLAHLDRHDGRRARRRLGAQLAHRRRAGDGDGPARRAQHRPAGARAPSARGRPGGVHDAHRHGHRGLGLGRRRPNGCASGPRWTAATRRSSMTSGCRAFLLCPLDRAAAGRGLARAASGARDRRDLPAADRAAEPLVRVATSPRSSTPWCTSTSRAPSSPSSVVWRGGSTNRRRRTRPPSSATNAHAGRPPRSRPHASARASRLDPACRSQSAHS